MRLIDADEFIETNKDIIDCSIDHSKYEDTLRELIDNAPTVDTTCPNCDSGYAQGYSDGYLIGKEERPQGKWIGKDGEYQCNKCYEKLWYRSDYCPQCGAYMMKEAENED